MDRLQCALCGGTSSPAARFCERCGAPLATYGAPASDTDPAAVPQANSNGGGDSRRDAKRLSVATVAIVVAGIVIVTAIVAGAVVLTHSNSSNRAAVTVTTVAATTTSRATTTTVRRTTTFAQVFAADSSGIVRVDSTGCTEAGVGTGFLVAPNLVATAAHVVKDSASVILHTGTATATGQVVGIDVVSDVALVRAVTPLTGHVFPVARSTPSIGTAVATIGFPEGMPISLTQGTISGLDRTEQFTDGMTHTGLIQTDTALNPGNSGGPLLTADGTVVGMVEGGDLAANGIGFATGADNVRPLLVGWEASPSPVRLASCGIVGSGGPDVQAALGLTQEWATALSSGDWVTARQLDPALAQTSDSALASGYGGLKEATIAYVAGDVQNLDVASVAYEDVGSGPRTNVYCYRLSVDLTTSTLTVLSSRRATGGSILGWVDPTTLDATIATC